MNVRNLALKPAQIGIIVLTLLTVIIHLALGQPQFILNGLGYLAAILPSVLQ